MIIIIIDSYSGAVLKRTQVFDIAADQFPMVLYKALAAGEGFFGLLTGPANLYQVGASGDAAALEVGVMVRVRVCGMFLCVL